MNPDVAETSLETKQCGERDIYLRADDGEKIGVLLKHGICVNTSVLGQKNLMGMVFRHRIGESGERGYEGCTCSGE